MKAKIQEHDERLELVVTCESYDEHILLNAFMRENPVGLPVSDHGNGNWSLTLGMCRCAARAAAVGVDTSDTTKAR